MREGVVANFATTAADGKEYQVDFYNLDVIISVGYRVKSQRGTQFRIWATRRLNEFIRKGFTMDDERLKHGGGRYFKELLQRVRDIRSSERNLYQQVTDIYATAIDYDPQADLTHTFFATVQKKCTTQHIITLRQKSYTIVLTRTNLLVGMTNFTGDYVTRDDVKIAKNYLSAVELQTLNLLVSQFLDFAELQALEGHAMSMKDWILALDRILSGNGRELLQGKGTISNQQAINKAEQEFARYRAKEMNELESDFDRMIRQLKEKQSDAPKEH